MSEYEQLTETLTELEREGTKTSGRMRDTIVRILNVSKSQVGKIDNIKHNAILAVEQAVKSDKMSISTANEVARLSPEKQKDIAEKKPEISHKEVKEIQKTSPPPLKAAPSTKPPAAKEDNSKIAPNTTVEQAKPKYAPCTLSDGETVEKNANYTVMANYHLKDRRLSYKAKGLLSEMLSLPPDWDYTLSGLAAIAADGLDSVRTAVREPEQYGYLVRSQSRDERGRMSVNEFIVYENPADNPDYIPYEDNGISPVENSVENAENGSAKGNSPSLENPVTVGKSDKKQNFFANRRWQNRHRQNRYRKIPQRLPIIN